MRARDRTVEIFMLEDDDESFKMSRKGLMKESESSNPVVVSASPLAEDIFVVVVVAMYGAKNDLLREFRTSGVQRKLAFLCSVANCFVRNSSRALSG